MREEVGWLGSGQGSLELRPLEVRSTLRRKGPIIHPRSASVPGREAGTSSFPLTFRPQPPPSSPAPDLPTPLGRARASQVFPSGKQLALRPHGGGVRDRLKESAVRTPSLGPVPALVVQPPSPSGPSALPTRASGRSAHRPAGGGGEALWVAQCGSPGSAGRQRRSLPGARPSRREQARRGGGAAPGPGGGSYIPGPSRRKSRRFLAGAGTAAATWGAGATPGAGGLEGE